MITPKTLAEALRKSRLQDWKGLLTSKEKRGLQSALPSLSAKAVRYEVRMLLGDFYEGVI